MWMLSLPTAFAYDWDSVEAPLGDDLTFQLCENNFTANQVTVIFDTADAWRAGTGELIRGADWTFIRGTDRSNCGPNNGYNEIYMRSASWFTSNGYGSSLAVTINDDPTVNAEVDIVFNSGEDWVNTLPSEMDYDAGERSLGATALHEFGHALGFNHEDDVISVMGSSHPSGRENGGKYRAHEDDYVGLSDSRPHASTGKNLLLGKFSLDVGAPFELWTDDDPVTQFCQQTYATGSGPLSIYAIIWETSGSETPLVEWRVSPDASCFAGGGEYVVGTRQPTMASNTPSLLHPAPWDFSSVPAGSYYLCAKIDPGNDIVETDNTDNEVMSRDTI